MINEKEIATKVYQFFQDILEEKGYSAFSLSRNGIHFYDACNTAVEGYFNLHEVANCYNGFLDKHLGFYSLFKKAVIEGLQEIIDLYFKEYPQSVIWVGRNSDIMVTKQGDWMDSEVFKDFYAIFAPVVKQVGGG